MSIPPTENHGFLHSLLLGPNPKTNAQVRPAIRTQCIRLAIIWRNKSESTFGIERLLRLFLALGTFLFPGLYIRHLSGLHGLLSQKLAVDLYVPFKVLLSVLILALGWQTHTAIQILIIYLALETLHYVATLLFLSDIYHSPISHKRSYLMFVMNYLEITLDFAILYSGLRLVPTLSSSIDAVYFSTITGFTIGYGDMAPDTSLGKTLVVLQAICSLFFLTLVFAKAVSSFTADRPRSAP